MSLLLLLLVLHRFPTKQLTLVHCCAAADVLTAVLLT
jgi:hypothetical protein